MDLAQDVTDDEGNLEAITWKTITVRLGDLKPWADNPKTITKAAAKRLLASWKDYGQVQTIAVSPSLVVLDGHQRLNVLMAAYGADYAIDARQASRELTEDEQKRLVVLLHAGAVGSWDWDSLSGWSAPDLMEWGMDSDALLGWKRDVAALDNMLGSEKPDYQEMWKGMPDFQQEDVFGAYHSVIVHFTSELEMNNFSSAIGQTITQKSKYIWYPKQEKEDLKSLVAHDES